jgi:23S rRNA pseudouridine1911/1915/1917 synthase
MSLDKKNSDVNYNSKKMYPQLRGGERDKDTLVEFIVKEEESGHRLDFVISQEVAVSRGHAQRLIKGGRVKLTPQRYIKPSIKVNKGDIVSVNMFAIKETELIPTEVDFEVLFFDDSIVVINKPSGLVVHPSKGHWDRTLVHGLLYRFPDIANINGVNRPGIVHRLDRTTSGLMVVARNGLAQETLFRDFKASRVNREYIGLCYGTPKNLIGEISLPIARNPYNRYKRSIVEDGRDARTGYNVIWSNSGFSLVHFTLHTGRTHQIRVHMNAINHPLVGDQLYAPGRHSSFDSCNRVFLHSWKLGFKHPKTRETICFVSPLTQDLVSFLKDISPKNHCPH